MATKILLLMETTAVAKTPVSQITILLETGYCKVLGYCSSQLCFLLPPKHMMSCVVVRAGLANMSPCQV